MGQELGQGWGEELVQWTRIPRVPPVLTPTIPGVNDGTPQAIIYYRWQLSQVSKDFCFKSSILKGQLTRPRSQDRSDTIRSLYNDLIKDLNDYRNTVKTLKDLGDLESYKQNRVAIQQRTDQ
jgi:hypothetical protein